MNFSFNRKEIIVALFALAISLLILDIVLTKVFKLSGNQIEKTDINSEDIKDRFFSGVHNFGIKDDWVAQDKNRVKQGDSLKYFFKIKVPKDLPIALLLNEITNSFLPGEITYFSRETKSNGTTNLLISSGGFDKLQAVFIYNPDIQRTTGSIGFLVYGLNSLDTAMQDQMIKFPEQYTTVLVPSKESVEISKRLKLNDKNYAVILNNDIKDLDYKLANSYSNERLKLSIRSILGEFSNAVAYFYNDNSGFAAESKFEFITKEFEKKAY